MPRIAVVIAALAGAAFVGCAVAAGPAAAQGPDRTQAGLLTCDISGGIGLIITSQKSLRCTFQPALSGRPPETYVGTITKFGLDVGGTTGGQMVWTVFEPSSRPVGGLAGSYVGATAEATFAAGLGANVLIGGSDRSVALQPLSLQGQAGLNFAAGVAELRLDLAR